MVIFHSYVSFPEGISFTTLTNRAPGATPGIPRNEAPSGRSPGISSAAASAGKSFTLCGGGGTETMDLSTGWGRCQICKFFFFNEWNRTSVSLFFHEWNRFDMTTVIEQKGARSGIDI